MANVFSFVIIALITTNIQLIFGDGDSGTCCKCVTRNRTGGCDADQECETVICNPDPFCCIHSWDNMCVNQAEGICVDGDGTESSQSMIRKPISSNGMSEFEFLLFNCVVSIVSCLLVISCCLIVYYLCLKYGDNSLNKTKTKEGIYNGIDVDDDTDNSDKDYHDH
eukprot:470684_1